MCLTPMSKTRDYRKMNERYQNATFVFGCGQCPRCLSKRKNSWVFRLKQEQKVSTSSAFLTLTYANTPTSMNGFPTLKTKDLQDFHKRLRTHIDRNYEKNKIRYYACGEYGTRTFRPHYHSIMMNLPKDYLTNPELIASIWGHGHVYVAPSNGKTIQYVAKYVMKSNEDYNTVCTDTGLIVDIEKEFSLMSKGLGKNYMTPQVIRWHKETLTTLVGSEHKMSLPRYYRDRIFTKDELETIYQSIQFEQELNFEKLFNNDYNNYETWIKEQFRKHKVKAEKERLVL